MRFPRVKAEGQSFEAFSWQPLLRRTTEVGACKSGSPEELF